MNRLMHVGGVGLSILFALLTVLSGATVRADSPPLPQNPQAAVLAAVKFDQRLDQQIDLDLAFRDEQGEGVVLRDYFHERPVIVVLAYYRCPMLCNQVLRGAATSVQALGLRGGSDYEVVVVSFDPGDTPHQAAELKETILARATPESKAGWHLLTGPAEQSARLAEQVGFQFQWDERSGQYAHASGIVVATPGGRISRYFYGIDYPPRDLRLGLVEASAGRIGSPIDQVLLFCFHYDPLTGRYGLAILNMIRVTGVGFVLALGSYIAISLRHERRTAPTVIQFEQEEAEKR